MPFGRSPEPPFRARAGENTRLRVLRGEPLAPRLPVPHPRLVEPHRVGAITAKKQHHSINRAVSGDRAVSRTRRLGRRPLRPLLPGPDPGITERHSIRTTKEDELLGPGIIREA